MVVSAGEKNEAKEKCMVEKWSFVKGSLKRWHLNTDLEEVRLQAVEESEVRVFQREREQMIVLMLGLFKKQQREQYGWSNVSMGDTDRIYTTYLKIFLFGAFKLFLIFWLYKWFYTQYFIYYFCSIDSYWWKFVFNGLRFFMPNWFPKKLYISFSTKKKMHQHSLM